MSETNWVALMEASGGSFEPAPAGVYDAIVADATVKSSSGGKDMYAVKFQVASGPLAGKPIWNNFTLSPENPNALGFFFKHMAALGLDAQFFSQNPSKQQVADALKGRRATLRVSVRMYQNQPRNNVDDVMPAGGPGMPIAGVPQMPSAQPAPAQPQPQPVAQPMPQPAPASQPVPQPAPAPAPAPVVQPMPAPQPTPMPQPAPAPLPPEQQFAQPMPQAPQAPQAPQQFAQPVPVPQPTPDAQQPAPAPDAPAPQPAQEGITAPPPAVPF